MQDKVFHEHVEVVKALLESDLDWDDLDVKKWLALAREGYDQLGKAPGKLLLQSKVSHDAFLKLRLGLAGRLRIDSGFELSSELRAWLSDYLIGRVVSPKVRRRSKQDAVTLHDRIARAIAALEEEGRPATRPAADASVSGCDIVVQALIELEEPRPNSYDGVAKIWQKSQRPLTRFGNLF